jgi:hypothetical protein
MSLKNEIWELLKDNQNKRVDDIYHNLTDYNPATIKQYLNALYKAKYLNAKNTTTKGLKNSSTIKLIKNTGSVAPAYSKGVLRDLNTFQEFTISKDKQYKKTETYLKYYLQAIIELNKEEVLNSEIVNKFKEVCPSINEDDKTAGTKVKRYRDKLMKKGLFVKSNESYRNSKYLQLNLKEIKTLYKKSKKINMYNIL